MIVTLDLEPQMEAQIAKNAAAHGVAVPDYLKTVIEGTVTPQPPGVHSQAQLAKNQEAIALLDQWDQEDATDDPEEIARHQAEWEEFKKGMNEAHTSNRIIYP